MSTFNDAAAEPAYTAPDSAGGQAERRGERMRSQAKTRKSVQTRERIMDAARDLMSERGSTGFQLGEVSQRCHMSKGSLYYYFADKDELVAAIFDEQINDLIACMEAAAARAATAREALGNLYSVFVRRLRDGRALAIAISNDMGGAQDASVAAMSPRFERATRVLANQVERAKAEGLVRRDVDSMVAAVYMLGGLITSLLAANSQKTTEDPDEMSSRLLELILYGMSGKEVQVGA